jgi:hypothetical protein
VAAGTRRSTFHHPLTRGRAYSVALNRIGAKS